MNKRKLPALRLGAKLTSWQGDPPDPHAKPALYEGVRRRRVFGFCVDVIILVMIGVLGWFLASFITLASLGILGGLAWASLSLIPLAYHTILIARYGQTFGMAIMDVTVRSYSGGPPSLLQALINTVLFYLGIAATANLVLLVSLFAERKRTLHDILSGTLAVRDSEL